MSRRPKLFFGSRRSAGSIALIPLVLSLALLSGCAGHESRVKAALDALDRGQPEQAVAELNQEMEVESADAVPPLDDDNALLLLDRGTILQSMDDYERSQRDLGLADKSIEMLDFSRGTADEIGKYLFSDDVGPYRAPPFEKLLINTFNMMNYLARRDLEGARVEARRLAVMQKYLGEQEETTSLLGLGSYLAGFTFEKSGRKDEALRYYDEALEFDRYPTLSTPLRVLTQGEGYSPRVDELTGKMGAPSVAETGEAELLVVVGYGRVPRKVPTRIPIGLALTMVSGIISPHDRAQANELAAKGLVTWINFPRLGKSRGAYSIPSVTLDGQPTPIEHSLDIEAEVRSEWEEQEPTVVLSAITRMITRILAGEAVSAGTKAAGGGKGSAGILGLIAGLATSAALSAADTPDTRSWTTLPANVALSRIRVPAGEHQVVVQARGLTKTYRFAMQPGGWAVLVATSLR